MICLDEGILRAHLDGELTEYEILSVNRHLSLCDACHRASITLAARQQELSALLGELAPLSQELRTDEAGASTRGARCARLPRGRIRPRVAEL